MAIDNSAIAVAAPELITTMDGTNKLIGSLVANPTIIIFDNQSTTSVVLSINDVQWKTFTGAGALVLDLRAAHGNATNYSFRVGDTFFGNGAANGSFSISYLYAQNF